MSINNGYDEKVVTEAIATALETFYNNLIAKIDELNIQKIMKRKNPYLYRAKAMQNAAEIVESVLNQLRLLQVMGTRHLQKESIL